MLSSGHGWMLPRTSPPRSRCAVAGSKERNRSAAPPSARRKRNTYAAPPKGHGQEEQICHGTDTLPSPGLRSPKGNLASGTDAPPGCQGERSERTNAPRNRYTARSGPRRGIAEQICRTACGHREEQMRRALPTGTARRNRYAAEQICRLARPRRPGARPRGRGGRNRCAARLPKPQRIVTPPSATITWPVMNEPALEASSTAMPPISSGSPRRRSGVSASRAALRAGSS